MPCSALASLEGDGAAHIADGSFVTLLYDWVTPFPGYHLYYPSRRQPMAAFALLVAALRYRA